MKRFTKEEILKGASIIDVAKSFSIPLENICSGNFTHRCRCPSPDHKSGSERTGSLYIDSVNNNFYCFGCGATNNVIDFYILKTQCDFSTAMLELSEFVDPAKISNVISEKRKSNFSILLKISELFRMVQLEHPEDKKWIEQVMKKTDRYIEDIDRHDIKKAKSLHSKVSSLIKRRF